MAKREMTEAQKKANAERMAKARAAKAQERKVAEEKAKAESEAVAETPVQPIQPIQQTVVQVAPKEENVSILYIDRAIPNNQIPLGNGRYITGSGRKFTIPMSEFEGSFMTPLHIALINDRKFIVLSGLTDEQREQYNCLYKEGEIITKNGMFDWFLDASTAEAKEKYEMLCRQHKELVARRFIDAYETNDNRITRDKVEALNRISKTDGEGLFTSILKEMNERSI